MTLGDFLSYLNNHPVYIIAYLIILPFAAFLAGVMGRGEGHLPPWKYLYSVIVYLVCIPGIFAIALNVYQFVFERGSIMNMQLNTQLLPVFSMVATLLIIRRNVDFAYIPGFDRLSGLLWMIMALLVIMWAIDKTRIIVFSYIPIQYLLVIFIALLMIIRLGWSRLFRPST